MSTETRPRSRARRTAAPKAKSAAVEKKSFVTPIAVLVGLLCGIGLLMVLSSSSVQALRESGSSWLYFQRQVIWLTFGTAALAVGVRAPLRLWQRLGGPLLILSFALLVLVLLPGFGTSVNGSTRWVDIGPLRLQPSELAKIALLLFGADLLARRAAHVDDPRAALVPMCVVLGGLSALVMLQPDMGTTIVLVLIGGSLLLLAGVPMRRLLPLAGAGVAAGIILAMSAPYRRARVVSFLDPWADAGNTGYQVVQSLVGMGSGQLTGVGLGASRAKWGFLPNAHTDFIFAIIGEELGLLGSLCVISLFAALAYLGARVAVAAEDRFGALIAGGATAWIAGQALVNMGAVVGLVPVTGVPLPFVSAGGSALVANLFAIGLLLRVARRESPAGAVRRRAPAS
ncbi:MAG TPA: putative lipid II flippase FtsW [Acidimicrobiales bacterium]|nr:putative lipid II flippase FtsW [Acidimicrobiales bacterium]